MGTNKSDKMTLLGLLSTQRVATSSTRADDNISLVTPTERISLPTEEDKNVVTSRVIGLIRDLNTTDKESTLTASPDLLYVAFNANSSLQIVNAGGANLNTNSFVVEVGPNKTFFLSETPAQVSGSTPDIGTYEQENTINISPSSATAIGNGVRGSALSFTDRPITQPVANDGGVLLQTNNSSLLYNTNNVTIGLDTETATAGGIDLPSVLDSSALTNYSNVPDKVSASTAVVSTTTTSTVIHNGTANIRATISVDNKDLALGTTGATKGERIDNQFAGQVTVSPPSVASGAVKYSQKRRRNICVVAPDKLSATSFSVSLATSGDPSFSTVNLTDATIRGLAPELCIYRFDPSLTGFKGYIDPSSTSFSSSGISAFSGGTQADSTATNHGFIKDSDTGKAVKHVHWLTSANGGMIPLFSNRTMNQSPLASPPINEFGHTTTKDSPLISSGSAASATDMVTSNGAIGWNDPTDGTDVGNADVRSNYYLGLVTTSVTAGHPFKAKPWSFFSQSVNGGAYTVTKQDYNTAAGSSQDADYYQNMDCLWLYNLGSKNARLIDFTLDNFQHRTDSTEFTPYTMTGGANNGSTDPNLIFKHSDNKVCSPIKVHIAKVGDSDATMEVQGTQKSIFFDSGIYNSGTVTTTHNGCILNACEEFYLPQAKNEVYIETDSAMCMTYDNASTSGTFKTQPIQVWYSPINISNADSSANGATPSGTIIRAKLTVTYITQDTIVTANAAGHSATNILSDLDTDSNGSVDSQISSNVKTVSVWLLFKYEQDAGNLSLTDEDNDGLENATVDFGTIQI